MHHRQQTKEQFQVEDSRDPKGLDCRVSHAHYYEALPQLSGSEWSKVLSRSSRPVSIHSVPSSGVIDTDKGYLTAHVPCDYVLASKCTFTQLCL